MAHRNRIWRNLSIRQMTVGQAPETWGACARRCTASMMPRWFVRNEARTPGDKQTLSSEYDASRLNRVGWSVSNGMLLNALNDVSRLSLAQQKHRRNRRNFRQQL